MSVPLYNCQVALAQNTMTHNDSALGAVLGICQACVEGDPCVCLFARLRNFLQRLQEQAKLLLISRYAKVFALAQIILLSLYK